MNQEKRYAVSIEICHILTEDKANKLAEEIKNKLNHINEDVYVCVSSYKQVREREDQPETLSRLINEASCKVRDDLNCNVPSFQP